MTKEEAIKYCWENRDEYIRDAESVDEGRKQFDCLVDCLDSGHIRPDELEEYGMDY